MSLNKTLQTIETYLASIGLPAGPDTLLNHETLLGCLFGALGAFAGWLVTEPFTREFPFWRDLYILCGVGFFICLFIVSAESLLQRDAKILLSTLRMSCIYALVLIVPAALVTKLILTRPSGGSFASTRIFLLDVSGSMKGHPLQTLKRALHGYVDTVEKRAQPGKVKLGCVIFENVADIVANPTTDYDSFRRDVDALAASGSTNMAAGLAFTKDILSRDLSSAEVILITDGKPNDAKAVQEILPFFKENNVAIDTVGAGREYDRPLLEQIASQTKGKFAPADDIGQLVSVVTGLAERGLTEASSDPEHKIPIRMRILGWMLIGVAVGICSALVSSGSKTVLFDFLPVPQASTRSVFFGLLGGAVGGALGAGVFELIQYGFNLVGASSGAINRLVGFVTLGLCIGFMVNLVQAATMPAWIRIIRGKGEGRLFVLERLPAILGRSELVDVPVFGDLNIAERNLRFTGTHRATRVATLGELRNLKVNGMKTREATLTHLDTFVVGNTEFIYLNQMERLR